MVKVKLQELLDKEERNLKWVERKTGIAYSTLHKLNSGNTTSINFNTINQICDLFDCKIQDLIEYIKED